MAVDSGGGDGGGGGGDVGVSVVGDGGGDCGLPLPGLWALARLSRTRAVAWMSRRLALGGGVGGVGGGGGKGSTRGAAGGEEFTLLALAGEGSRAPVRRLGSMPL